MTDDTQETQGTPPTGDEAPPSVEPLTPTDPEAETHAPNDAHTKDDSEPKTDAEQGVGLAPTEPGDAGEGNPGTAFQTTEEVEAADLSKSGEVPGVQ
jgi:hypothetical protein